jgi:hypothetical protein
MVAAGSCFGVDDAPGRVEEKENILVRVPKRLYAPLLR